MKDWLKKSRSWPLKISESLATSLERMLELLMRDCERLHDLVMPESDHPTGVQVAQPPESVKELHVGEVPEVLARRLEDLASTSGGALGRPEAAAE